VLPLVFNDILPQENITWQYVLKQLGMGTNLYVEFLSYFFDGKLVFNTLYSKTAIIY
jgi:hypothetical protein